MLNALFKAERPRRNIVCVVSSFEAMLRTLQTGPYLGVVPEHALRAHPNPALSVVPLAFELPAYRVSAGWHNVGHHDPALQWLRGQLQQVCLELA
jgi:DNA-binding transcriptional LysR family regulator